MAGPVLLTRQETTARGSNPARSVRTPDRLPLRVLLLIPLAIALIVAKDVLLRRAPFVIAGITDEAAHAITALLAVGALYALLRRPLTTGGIVATILGGTLIDLDHIPLALGREWLTTETDRPFTHSLLVLGLLLVVAVMLRGSRREVGLVATLALASHFVEDMGDGNVPLLWPLLHHGVSVPYAVYIGLLLVCAGVIALRQYTGDHRRVGLSSSTADRC